MRSEIIAGLILLILAVVINGHPCAPAQVHRPTIRADVSLVEVVLSATDSRGRFIRDLKAEDFEVFENKQPQKIEYFNNLEKNSEVPLTIALLIDTSGSVRSKLPYEKKTAAEFFSQVLRPDKDLALIIQFDSDANLVQDFTSDPKSLIEALDDLDLGKRTVLFDAIYLASEEKLKGEAGRKVIVVITDGDDTYSKISKEEAVRAAQKNDVLIYGIGVRGDGANFGVLKSFAVETGGAFFSPRAKIEEIRNAFLAIGEELKGQYSLAYISTNPRKDGSYRAIEVRCKTEGVRIRARKGYFAPKSSEVK